MLRTVAKLSLVGILFVPSGLIAQTWIGNSSGNWSAGSNWLGGTPPGVGGGSTVQLAFSNTANGNVTASNDLGNPFVLNRMDLQPRYGLIFGAPPTFLGTTIDNVAGNSLRFEGSGASIQQLSSAVSRVASGLDFNTGLILTGAGSGNVQLAGNLSGTGGLTLNSASTQSQFILLGTNNSFSGGVTLQNGNLSLDNSTALGTGTLMASGGTMRFNSFAGTAGIQLANAMNLTGTFTFRGNNSGVLNGVIDGGGNIVHAGDAGITLRLTNANTYSGTTAINFSPTASGNTISLEGANGAAATGSSFTISRASSLQLDNRQAPTSGVSGGNNVNRLGDSATLNLHSRGILSYFANDSTTPLASTETIGVLNAGGSGFVTINSGVAATNRSGVLTFTTFNPQASSMTLFRGINLGGAAPGTAGNDNILFGNGTTLLGGGGAAGTTTISVMANGFGHFNNGVSSTTWFGGGNSLATYDATAGVRPLNTTTEYATTINSGSSTQNNVRLIAPLTGIDADTTINALVLDRTNSTTYGQVSGTGTLRVTSGLVLVTGTGGTAVNRNSISVATLDFGSREGVVIAPEVITISSNLTGNAGLHKASGFDLTLAGNNTGLSGPITISGGRLSIASTTNLGGTGDIRLNGGFLTFTASDTLTRGIQLGDASGWLDAPAATAWTAAGGISGNGSLVKSGAGTVTLAGNNTYSGTTILSNGVLSISSAANLGSSAGIVLAPNATLQNTASTTLNQPITLTAGGGSRTVETIGDLTLAGPIGHNGVPTNALSLTKTGPATLTLSATNTFNGVLAVNAGTVRVNGFLGQVNVINAGQTATDYGVLVSAGATLGGTGTIQRDVNFLAGSILSPGNSVGTLTVNGLVNIASNWNYAWELGAGNVGDALNVNGSIVFNSGTATLQVSSAGGNPLTTDVFVLATATGGISGTLPAFTIDYSNTPGWNGGTVLVQGYDLILTNVAVPEPATVVLVSIAGLTTLGVAYRRRKLPQVGRYRRRA
jgi:fibronectin-binding autotransporter adhesin